MRRASTEHSGRSGRLPLKSGAALAPRLARRPRRVLRHDHGGAFIDRYNAAWLIEKNGLKSPRETRATWERDLMRAAA